MGFRIKGAVVAAFASAALMSSAEVSAGRTTVRTEAELPASRFTLDGKPSAAFLDDMFLAKTVPVLRVAAEQLLANSEIQNPAIMQRVRNGLASIALLQNRPTDAARLLAEQRAAETKPQLKMIGQALLDASASGLAARPTQRCAAASARLRALLAAADPAVARDEVLQVSARAQLASGPYYAGTLADILDPSTASRGSVGLLDGLRMAQYRALATLVPPCRAGLTAVAQDWIGDPRHRPANFWTARQPDTAVFGNAKPVVVAVWDSGVDESLFAGQMALDPAEPLDGRDNDGNGVIDDIHGPTFTARLVPDPASLTLPSSKLTARLGFQMALDKGEHDLAYGKDTQEARMFAVRGREASAADQALDVEGSHEQSGRSHGTMVASEIADGAPFVRLYNVRVLAFDTAAVPTDSGEDLLNRFATMVGPVVDRMRKAGVRVANLSWGLGEQEIIDGLMDFGFETDPARAKQRAEAVYRRNREAMKAAISAAPEILFVLAAGNSNQPDDIQGDVPQTLGLPNIIVVGAAGSGGQPTTFTTFGKLVDVYARGDDVPVRFPGGMSASWSGTSMAAPLVARAAASMLAVNPNLTTSQLIAGLKQSSTPGEGGMLLINARQAVSWAGATTATPPVH